MLVDVLVALGATTLFESGASKPNAHLFSCFFADRHDIQENETMKLT